MAVAAPKKTLINLEDNVLFSLPTKIVFGPGTTRQVGSLAERLRVRSAFIVTDAGVRNAGLVDGCTSSLEQAGIRYDVFDDVGMDPTSATIYPATEQARAFGAECVIAIGGGSPIVAAKAIALLVPNGGMLSDYEGSEKYRATPLPTICIPTTAGSGAEVSPAIPVTEEARQYKVSISGHSLFPAYAVLDPELLISLPPGQAMMSGMDALTHAIEAYTSIGTNPVTDVIALAAVRDIMQNIAAHAFTADLQAKGKQLLASTMANVACGNAGLGLVHATNKCVHAISLRTGRPPVAHGLINGIMLPRVMEYNLPVVADRYAALAVQAMGEPAAGRSQHELAHRAVEQVKELIRETNFPRRIPWENDLTEADFREMAQITLKGKQTAQNRRRPSESDLVRLFKDALAEWA